MKILTISIAAYNMEEYIRQTLDSLIDERVIGELEVFVVDDGGTDRTLDIAKEYAARYPDSIIPVHKENGGYGTTVNYSLAHATGKYFKLLDGDDWFDTEGLAALVRVLRDAEEDVIVSAFYVAEDGNGLRLAEADVREGWSVKKVAEIEGKSMNMWPLAFRTRLLKDIGLELPGRLLYTDRIFSTVPFAYADRVRFCRYPVYCYRLGREGQSVSRASRVKYKQDTLQVSLALCAFYEEHKTCANRGYILHRVVACYKTAVKTILLDRPTADNLEALKAYDRQVMAASPDVFRFGGRMKGRIGAAVRAMRRTDYLAYWLFARVPKRAFNFRIETVPVREKFSGGVTLPRYKFYAVGSQPFLGRAAA